MHRDWSKVLVDAVGLTATLPYDKYIAEYFEVITTLYSDIRPWPGTHELLAELKSRGFPMAIATSTPRLV